MAKHKNSAANKVRQYMKVYPTAAPKEVAKAIGVALHVVHSTMWRDKKFGPPKRKYKTRAKPGWQTVAVLSSNAPIEPKVLEMPITMVEPEVSMVDHPPHYTVGGIEVIDFIKAKLTLEEFRGYLKGNVLKYTSRAGHKDDAAQDIGKLVWYATKLQEAHIT